MHGNRKFTNEERFHKFYEIMPSDCWEWQKSLDRDGYGYFWYDSKTSRGHKYAWELYFGDRGGLCVLHTCDNPCCVNPDHLFLGTHQDNVKDRDSKGRQVKGSKQHLSKLTEEQVRAIRKDSRKHRIIANEYNIAKSNIWFIKSRTTWKHVE